MGAGRRDAEEVLAVVVTGGPGDPVSTWLDHDGRLPRVAPADAGPGARVPGHEDLFPVAPTRSIDGLRVQVLRSPSASPPPAGWSLALLDDVQDDVDLVGHVRRQVEVLLGRAPRPPLRESWYDEAWLEDRSSWVDRQLERRGRRRLGAGRALQVWPLSAVLRFAAEDSGGGPADVVLKCSCSHFEAEPRLTELVAGVAPELVPEVLAVDEAGRCLLQEALPAGWGAPEEDDLVAAAEALATLQVRALSDPRVAASRLPDRGLGMTRAAVPELVAPGRDRQRVVQVVDRLAAVGLPETLAHGDLHRGNLARLPDGTLRAFDWSDTSWAHPALDVVHLLDDVAPDSPVVDRAWAAWAERWAAHLPGWSASTREIRLLASAVDMLHQLLTYRLLVPTIEPGGAEGLVGVTGQIRSRLVREAAGLVP